MLYAVPVSDFLPGSSALCSWTRLPSKIDYARILSGAEEAGALLKHAAVKVASAVGDCSGVLILCGFVTTSSPFYIWTQLYSIFNWATELRASDGPILTKQPISKTITSKVKHRWVLNVITPVIYYNIFCTALHLLGTRCQKSSYKWAAFNLHVIKAYQSMSDAEHFTVLSECQAGTDCRLREVCRQWQHFLIFLCKNNLRGVYRSKYKFVRNCLFKAVHFTSSIRQQWFASLSRQSFSTVGDGTTLKSKYKLGEINTDCFGIQKCVVENQGGWGRMMPPSPPLMV